MKASKKRVPVMRHQSVRRRPAAGVMHLALDLTLRSCCSFTLFKYFEDRTFVSSGSKPSGFVNLSRLRRKDGRKEHRSENVGRISGDFGDFAALNESRRELFAIE
jgi:hypothetical protein